MYGAGEHETEADGQDDEGPMTKIDDPLFCVTEQYDVEDEDYEEIQCHQSSVYDIRH